MKVGAILLGATLATTLACSGAKAGLIDLNGYIGPVQFKFQNYESFTGNTITPGAMDFGVVKVTSIVNPVTGTNLWVQGQGGQFLAAVFNGITVNTVTPTSSGVVTTNTGGTFQLWLDSADFDPTQGTSGYMTGGCSTVGSLCYNGITNTGGIDLVDFNLVPATTSDPTNTLNATVSTTTLPTSGSAEGFADITGGADASEFGRGDFTTLFAPADLHFLNDFCGNGQPGCVGPTSSDWQLFSHDPLDAVVVPEPASLALLGTALLGFGSLARRRIRLRK